MGTRLRSFVLWTSGATAILMLVGALFIAASEALSLPYAIDAQRYAALALHLAIHAFLLSEATQQASFAVVRNRLAVFGRNILVVLPLATFSFVNLFIANIAWRQEDERTWLLALAFPAVIGLWLAAQILSDNHNMRKRKAVEIRNVGDPDAWTLSVDGMRALIARKEPADPNLVFEEAITRAITAGAYAFVSISLVLVGMFFGVLLNGILFKGYDAEIVRVVWAFPLVIADASAELQRIWIIGTAAIFGIFLLYGFLLWAVSYSASFAKGRRERELTHADLVFIEHSMQSIVDYLQGRSYPARFVKFYDRLSGGALVLLLAILLTLNLVDPLAPLEAQRTEGLTWYLYESRLFGSIIVGFLALMSLNESIRRIVVLPYEEFAEFAVIGRGFNRANSPGRGLEDFFYFLVKLVRRDRIDVTGPINVKEFIQVLARENVRRFHTISVILVALTVGFVALDANFYHLFSDKKIEYSRYLSFDVVTLRYEDVPRVETQCRLTSAGGTRLTYRVYFTEEVRRDLIDNENDTDDGHEVARDLDTLENIDAELVAAAVPFGIIDRESDDEVEVPGFEVGCLEALAERFDTSTYERIAKLLHAPERLVEEGRR